MNETIVLCLSILLLTSFVRVFTSLTILRYALGLYFSSFGIIFFALSLSLSLYVASENIEKIGGISNISNYEVMQEKFKPFLEKKVDKSLYERFKNDALMHEGNKAVNNDTILKGETDNNEAIDTVKEVQVNLSNKKELDLLTFTFVLSELRDALKYGIMIIIPFLIIDLIVMNIFMVLGVKSFPYQVASLPIKLGVFVACDGLKIVTEKLINYYM